MPRTNTDLPSFMRRQPARIELDDIPEVIKFKVGLKQHTLFVLQTCLHLLAKETPLLSGSIDVTVETCVGRIPDNVIRGQFKPDTTRLRHAGLADSGRAGPDGRSFIVGCPTQQRKIDAYTGQASLRQKGIVVRQDEARRSGAFSTLISYLRGSRRREYNSLCLPSTRIQPTTRKNLQHRGHLIVYCLRIEQDIPALLIVDS